MRYFFDAGLLALYCAAAFFRMKMDINTVVAVLCVVIMVCTCYANGKKTDKNWYYCDIWTAWHVV